MKTYNCFFSPAGGTARVASIISEGLGGAEGLDILNSVPSVEFRNTDIVIISVPSYGGRVPAPAAERISAMKGNGAKAVLVAVFGNRAQDDTLLELCDLMTAAGFRCRAAVEAVAEHSLLPRFGTGRPDPDDEKELMSYGERIRKALSSEDGELHLPGGRPYRKYDGVPLKPSASSACIRCGKCAAECPAGAIPMENPSSTDRKKCISCMHCVKICPVHARSTGKVMPFLASLMMKKTCSERKQDRLYLPSEK